MSTWNKQYPIDTEAGGDSVYQGFVKVNNEFTAVYDKLNVLRTARAGTTPPADAETNELWLDTSVTPPILKYYDGTSWNQVNEMSSSEFQTLLLANDGEGSGLDADLVRGLPADFTCSKNSSGYQKLPSGIIIQWTTFSASGGSATISFPISFPTAVLSVVTGTPCSDGDTDGIDFVLGIDSVTTSSITVSVPNYSSKTGYILAIGY